MFEVTWVGRVELRYCSRHRFAREYSTSAHVALVFLLIVSRVPLDIGAGAGAAQLDDDAMKSSACLRRWQT